MFLSLLVLESCPFYVPFYLVVIVLYTKPTLSPLLPFWLRLPNHKTSSPCPIYNRNLTYIKLFSKEGPSLSLPKYPLGSNANFDHLFWPLYPPEKHHVPFRIRRRYFLSRPTKLNAQGWSHFLLISRRTPHIPENPLWVLLLRGWERFRTLLHLHGGWALNNLTVRPL